MTKHIKITIIIEIPSEDGNGCRLYNQIERVLDKVKERHNTLAINALEISRWNYRSVDLISKVSVELPIYAQEHPLKGQYIHQVVQKEVQEGLINRTGRSTLEKNFYRAEIKYLDVQ